MNISLCINFNPFVSIIGLILDIVGAWLVAWEVVVQYKYPKFIEPKITMADMTDISALPAATEHPQYRIFEINKYRKMKWGLIFLTAGFILQIIPNIFQLLE
jgi:hypothetical protein